ncbi:hypothetical protein [Arthrobacter sp. 35W]|uniref:hypothetical protein n=1 Tax=Arthrobacter sp. 35W TaxID=1132441 RepID=UPI00040ECEC7|nr:hypothetical protein [Arthrobacter sp. 35W]
MDLELRTIPDCPHATSAGELFTRALDLEGLDPAALAVREISTDADAEALGFHGSPTFTIDGADLFPADTDPALTWRVYPTPQGLAGQPARESLRAAVRAALARSGRTA